MKNLYIYLLLIAPMHLLGQGLADTEVSLGTELAEVQESVLMHFPLIKAVQTEIDASEAMITAAEGAFDPVIDGSYKNRLSGFYSGDTFDTSLSKRFPMLGTRVFGSYRQSSGSFPVYENGLLTTDDGEVRFGLSLSLLRDRDIDDLRYRRSSAEVDFLSQTFVLRQSVINVLQAAYVAYARWLQAARLLTDYEELQNIAETRAEAVNRSVEAGNTAEILAVDNELAVIQRRGLVVDAQRLLDAASHQLSLYLRNPDGTPKAPFYSDDLNIEEDNEAIANADIPMLLDRIVELSPQIAIANLEKEQLSLDLDLANNLAKPKLDLRFYNSRDFGGGITSLRGSENVADISFSIPLETRTARGRASAAKSKISAVDFRIQQLVNRAETDLKIARTNLEATREMEELAEMELDAAQQLAEAEARRVDAGLSDFFVLNQREQYVAEAELKRWQAHFAHQVALAEFYAVSLDLEALGFETDPQE